MAVDTNELLHRIGSVLRVISDKMERLIEISERVEGQVRLPSEEESKTFADAKGPAKKPVDHPAGPQPDPGEGYRLLSKDPPEELQPGDEYELAAGHWDESSNALTHRRQGPRIWYRRKVEPAQEAQPAKPKRWRILDDKEIIQASEWYNAKVNKPRKWPPHGGWQELEENDICIGLPAGEFPSLIWCREVTDDVEAAEPPEPEYREPLLPADAGKMCEFSNDGQMWFRHGLAGFVNNIQTNLKWQAFVGTNLTFGFAHARIRKDA